HSGEDDEPAGSRHRHEYQPHEEDGGAQGTHRDAVGLRGAGARVQARAPPQVAQPAPAEPRSSLLVAARQPALWTIRSLRVHTGILGPTAAVIRTTPSRLDLAPGAV